MPDPKPTRLSHPLLVGALSTLLAVPPVALAQEAPAPAPAPAAERDADNPIRGDEITPEQQKAVEKGLEFLASQQNEDGSFGSGGGAATAVTALSVIAFMGAGHLPGRGKYGDVVSRGVDFLIASTQPSGLIAESQSRGVMYAHGFATLCLGEVYGMTGDERVKEPLTRAVRLIMKSQNPEGGWRYQPAPLDADISVTICQIMALRAARDAGIKVEKETIDNAVEYVKKCQNRDGGFSYMLSGNGRAGGDSAFPRSAAGVASLYYAGIYEGEAIERGLAYIARFKPGRSTGRNSHFFYGHYYAAQAMFLAGGEHWAEWYPAVRDYLIAQQQPRGNWSDEHTDEYCTAMALIVLQMPNRYLPVFAGKGPGS